MPLVAAETAEKHQRLKVQSFESSPAETEAQQLVREAEKHPRLAPLGAGCHVPSDL